MQNYFTCEAHIVKLKQRSVPNLFEELLEILGWHDRVHARTFILAPEVLCAEEAYFQSELHWRVPAGHLCALARR
jgi:hypothetical protein